MRPVTTALLATALMLASSVTLASPPPGSAISTPKTSMQSIASATSLKALGKVTYDRQGNQRQQGERVNIRTTFGAKGFSLGLRSLGVGRDRWTTSRGESISRTSWRVGSRGRETLVTKTADGMTMKQTYSSGGWVNRKWTATLSGTRKLADGLTVKTHAEAKGGDDHKVGLHGRGTSTATISDRSGKVIAKSGG